MAKVHNAVHLHDADSGGGDGVSNPFTEFLNPNSMITPGAAGAFTMVITNTLCQQFAELPLNFTGLAVSFLFGAVVFGYGASLPARAMYYVINSLIIFVVAVGSSTVGVGIDRHVNKAANVAALTTTSGVTRSVELAAAGNQQSDQKKEQQSSEPQAPPPPKPKFFRQWF